MTTKVHVNEWPTLNYLATTQISVSCKEEGRIMWLKLKGMARIFPYIQHLWDHIWNTVSSLGLPSRERHWQTAKQSSRRSPRWLQGYYSTSCVRRAVFIQPEEENWMGKSHLSLWPLITWLQRRWSQTLLRGIWREHKRKQVICSKKKST